MYDGAVVCANSVSVGRHLVSTRLVQPVATCRHISISQLLSLWRHSHYDVLSLQRSQPLFSLWRHSDCDVIRYWAGHAHRYGRTYGHLIAFNI